MTRERYQSISRLCSHVIETSQLIDNISRLCSQQIETSQLTDITNQLTGYYKTRILALRE